MPLRGAFWRRDNCFKDNVNYPCKAPVVTDFYLPRSLLAPVARKVVTLALSKTYSELMRGVVCAAARIELLTRFGNEQRTCC